VISEGGSTRTERNRERERQREERVAEGIREERSGGGGSNGQGLRGW